ncbi:hypothetical protein [Sulfitobacter guttiformis]|uniref:hypothetical protein n=1 Tax=Sulfitobacter guttiformis TaxID=74349 RepID=UPI00046AFC1A|nr:hypothetical protein [Sulfitobacter guttiformis]
MHLVAGQQLVGCDAIDVGCDHYFPKVIRSVLDEALKLADDLIAEHLLRSGSIIAFTRGKAHEAFLCFSRKHLFETTYLNEKLPLICRYIRCGCAERTSCNTEILPALAFGKGR